MSGVPGLAVFDTWQLVALAAAVGWASGIRLYAVLFIVGGLGYLGVVDLPGGLSALAHPWVLFASGFMFGVEFFADKIPGMDTLWDTVHTFIRIPAGAALAASVFGDASAAASPPHSPSSSSLLSLRLSCCSYLWATCPRAPGTLPVCSPIESMSVIILGKTPPPASGPARRSRPASR
jgi:hypothetical protein